MRERMEDYKVWAEDVLKKVREKILKRRHSR